MSGRRSRCGPARRWRRPRSRRSWTELDKANLLDSPRYQAAAAGRWRASSGAGRRGRPCTPAAPTRASRPRCARSWTSRYTAPGGPGAAAGAGRASEPARADRAAHRPAPRRALVRLGVPGAGRGRAGRAVRPARHLPPADAAAVRRDGAAVRHAVRAGDRRPWLPGAAPGARPVRHLRGRAEPPARARAGVPGGVSAVPGPLRRGQPGQRRLDPLRAAGPGCATAARRARMRPPRSSSRRSTRRSPRTAGGSASSPGPTSRTSGRSSATRRRWTGGSPSTSGPATWRCWSTPPPAMPTASIGRWCRSRRGRAWPARAWRWAARAGSAAWRRCTRCLRLVEGSTASVLHYDQWIDRGGSRLGDVRLRRCST